MITIFERVTGMLRDLEAKRLWQVQQGGVTAGAWALRGTVVVVTLDPDGTVRVCREVAGTPPESPDALMDAVARLDVAGWPGVKKGRPGKRGGRAPRAE